MPSRSENWFRLADPAHTQIEQLFRTSAVVAMASKQYNPFTDFRVRLVFGSPLIEPSTEVPIRRCIAGVLGAVRFGTAYKQA